MADRDEIINDLRYQLDAASERRRQAATDLERAAEATTSGKMQHEDLEKLLKATREYSAADAEVANVLLRLNYVLGLPKPTETARVQPSNDHEVRISKIVNRLSREGRLQSTAIDQIIAILDFAMSRSEADFLVKYTRWRMDNPADE